jgi:hypothetical protein
MSARLLLLLAIASAALYAPNLADPFLGDDFDLILSFQGKPFSYFPSLLWSNESGDVWRSWGIDPAQGRGYLRPLKIWILAADYALWGTNPVGYHVTALASFVASILLAAALAARALPGRPALAAAGAVAAAFHPIFAEVVPFVTAREETLSSLFVLAALLAFVRHREDGRSPLACAVLFGLALLVKESSISFLPIAAAWDLAHGRLGVWRAETRRALLRAWAPLALVTAVYLGLRRAAFGNFVGGDGSPTHYFSLEALRFHGRFFASLIDPTLLWLDEWPAATWLAVGLALAPAVGVAFAWRRIPGPRRRDLLFFGPLWYLGSTALYTGVYFATRHHVLPILGLTLFAAVALGALLESGALRGERRWAAALVGGALLFFLPESLTTSLEFQRASRSVEQLRAEIERRTADLPDGSHVLLRDVPQLVLPPYYFGWGLLSALSAPFTASDLAGRVVVVNMLHRELNRVRTPPPREYDRILDLDGRHAVAPWIAARHDQRAVRDFGLTPRPAGKASRPLPAGPRPRRRVPPSH